MRFKGVLVLNCKTKGMRILKGKNLDTKKLSPYDILVNVDIEVVVPEKKIHEAKGVIEIPEEKFASIVLEEI